MELVRRVTYAQAYSFKYSPRPGTPAAADPLQVPEREKSARLQALQDLLNAQQLEFNRRTAGRTLDVLLERRGRIDGQLIGRSPYMQAVHVDAPAHRLGRIAPVLIEAGKANSLSGALAAPRPSEHAA
jgi:tRNA-2-methylthio-N6-dimethylallyladenosine synthase